MAARGNASRSSIAELEEAPKPVAVFMDQFDRRPLRSIGDKLHGIHVGTEFEAEITMGHLRRARAILNKGKEKE
ncbi:hypothetical protein CCR94_18980 [Rhodoblastus sphagnicola]|uniref:Uncharacterized protein n=1 Tax=Rhodoblastus sphagnicola TaxID=333368 RepID=A0A2S6N010_9HYPH|nr:hypothetical protein CCR94_18980 [Rhodoblastus sphagnicola]